MPVPVEDPPRHNSLAPRGAEPVVRPPLPRTAFPCTYLSTSSRISPQVESGTRAGEALRLHVEGSFQL